VPLFALLLQAAPAEGDWVDRIILALDSPLPFSPLSEYLIVLGVIWLFARRHERKSSFDREAQEVLDTKYGEGELSEKAYEKYRQDMSLRPKR
jgi:hypothetical protein